MNASIRDKTALLLSTYLIFFAMAFPPGIFTAAWVYMQATYDLPLDALGVLMIAGMFGSLLGTFFSGRLIGRFGIGRYLTYGSAILTLGVLIYALAPSWLMLIVAMFVTNAGFHVLNTGLNTAVSAHYSTGQLNWMHAAYPIGGTLGSLLVTLIVERAALSWHLAYALVLVIFAGITVMLVLTRQRWRHLELDADESAPEFPTPPAARRVSMRDSLLLPAVLVGMLLFFLTTGATASVVNLSKSLLTTREIEGATYWISFFWGFTFVGRAVAGFITFRLSNAIILNACMIGMTVGAGLLALPANAALNFVGLMLFGIASAPVYPMLIAESHRRVAPRHRANALGFQIAASGLAIGLVPAAVAWLAERASVDVIGILPMGIMLASLALYQVALRRQRIALRIGAEMGTIPPS